MTAGETSQLFSGTTGLDGGRTAEHACEGVNSSICERRRMVLGAQRRMEVHRHVPITRNGL